MVGRISIL